MKAVHIRTKGMFCEKCPHRVECELAGMPGVEDVQAFWRMGMTSVLYDPDVVDILTIRDAVARAGFGADILVGTAVR